MNDSLGSGDERRPFDFGRACSKEKKNVRNMTSILGTSNTFIAVIHCG